MVLNHAKIDPAAWAMDSLLVSRGVVGIRGDGSGPYTYNDKYFVHYLNTETSEFCIHPKENTPEYDELVAKHGSSFHTPQTKTIED